MTGICPSCNEPVRLNSDGLIGWHEIGGPGAGVCSGSDMEPVSPSEEMKAAKAFLVEEFRKTWWGRAMLASIVVFNVGVIAFVGWCFWQVLS